MNSLRDVNGPEVKVVDSSGVKLVDKRQESGRDRLGIAPMRRILTGLLAALCALGAAPPKPKLVLAIVIDQFRYDYLTRLRGEYKGGFDRLLTKGAVFTNARYIHFPTVTAVGHSTFLSGATPSVSGIVGNEWFDYGENHKVTSVEDAHTRLLGGSDLPGASPRRMLVSTIGDELKMANDRRSRVIGISLKDRAAILPVGHMADGAYWFDVTSGNFVSSTYYFKELPGWVKEFNAARPGDRFRGVTWLNHKLPEGLKELYGTTASSPIESSPFGNDLVEMLAERALTAAELGKRGVTDVLAVSFSSNDKVGHDFGTYSPEERAVTLRTDELLEQLFRAVDKQVGLNSVLVVLTGDHGVSPSAEESAANHMPGGRMPGSTVAIAVQGALDSKYGRGNWVSASLDLAIYLNRNLMRARNLDMAEVRREAAEAALGVEHIFRVYTRDQLLAGAVPGDDVSRLVTNGYNVKRGADLIFIPEPFWAVSSSVATHGTPFGYDTHVPVIFMGSGIRAGAYYGNVTVNDIAPTLSSILEIEPPAGAFGRVLTEMFAPAAPQRARPATAAAATAAPAHP